MGIQAAITHTHKRPFSRSFIGPECAVGQFEDFMRGAKENIVPDGDNIPHVSEIPVFSGNEFRQRIIDQFAVGGGCKKTQLILATGIYIIVTQLFPRTEQSSYWAGGKLSSRYHQNLVILHCWQYI